MKNKFIDDYKYMPETYYYPHDKDIIQSKFKGYHLDINDLWFLKPVNLSGGRGISIFKSLNSIKYNQYVLTKCVTNVHLIKEKKYDIRFFILITGLKPLRIYLYKDGLVRRATKNYSLKIDSLNDKYIHLTNTDINKYHKNYNLPKHYNDENANIWNLNVYQKYLEKNNVNWDSIHDKICDLIIKTIISVYQELIDKLERDNLNDRSFFNILGFDILITENYEPILLEVNHAPSVNIYDNLDIILKRNLLVDTFNRVGITPFSIEMFDNINKENNLNDNVDESINYFLFSRKKIIFV